MTEQPLAGMTILVVDNCPKDWGISANILRAAGAEVIQATTVAEARKTINCKTTNIAAVVTENHFPGHPSTNHGVEVDNNVRFNDKPGALQIPVIIISHTEVSIPGFFNSRRFTGFVPKDTPEQLVEAIIAKMPARH